MNKKEILSDALGYRKQELLNYEINIENYKRAIEKSKSDPDLQDFRDNLEQILKTEIIEKKKSQVMHDIISEQLEELNVHQN